MIKFFLCFLLLTFSISADRYKADHVCSCKAGVSISSETEHEILTNWELMQDMNRHPNIEKMLSIMDRCKEIVEYNIGMSLDAERHLELIFNYLHIMKMDISPKNARIIQKIILKKSLRHYKYSDMHKLVPVGISIAMCGLYLNYVSGEKYQQLNGDTIIAYGLSLVHKRYKNG